MKGDEQSGMLTISQVSRAFNVTPRMLRHYEKIGLLPGKRIDDYAYRVYDEDAIRRLQYIIVLRKLRIPLKEISAILNDPEQVRLIEIIQENINELNIEITALNTIRDVLKIILSRLSIGKEAKLKLDLLSEADILNLIEPLSPSRIPFKEECSIENLNKANEVLDKLKNVRIVLLPPCTVAAYHFVGENPEETVGDAVDKFVRESRLYQLKADSRMFGFDHPSPSPERQYHGYEVWVTIPDDMEVPEPLVKKSFKGGLYAAHTIVFPNFHEWEYLKKWVEESDKYTADYIEQEDDIMGGCLEEHLNWVYSSHMHWPENGIDGNIDLLLPIKMK
jgi:DNA-binding transcriptional MerR regulator/DNA gyrase inhibitor GyrI